MLRTLVIATLVFAQSQPPPGSGPKAPPAPDCRELMLKAAPGSRDLCQAIDEARAGDAAADPAEKQRRLSGAADLFARAADQLRDPDAKIYAIEAVARLYGTDGLNQPRLVEQALRNLVPLMPRDSSPLRRIADIQEASGDFDSAEQTLLSARQLTPDDPAVYLALSAFYGNRAAALQKTDDKSPPDPGAAGDPPPGHPASEAPSRDVVPLEPIDQVVPAQYPIGAFNAGIEGDVAVEVRVDERGLVVGARVLQSIPGLDEEALKAARQWRFTPKMVDGRAEPATITMVVRFRR